MPTFQQAKTANQKSWRIKYAAILKYIAECNSKYGVPPTLAELSSHFGSSNKGTSRRWLQSLAKNGHIKYTLPGVSRAYKITDKGVRYMNRYYEPDIEWEVGERIDVQ